MPYRPPRSFAASPLNPREFGLIALQLALLLVLVHQFQLEAKRHLWAALGLATGGFFVHAWLPARWRRAWFLLVSIAGVVLVLGPQQTGWLLVAAGLLIAAAEAPLPIGARFALVAGLMAVAFVARRQSEAAFWPILGSMFMFRMLLYLQTRRRERRSPDWGETGAYFLMMPNAFFPLFPVVDFDTFRETYYNAERRDIYQTGVHWIATGVLHLLVYRFLKYEVLPTPLEIRTATDMAVFLATNYALYVRISGQFHVICGMLHLFGYHLPRTHDAYFLASSFSDIWRRINIYWKDFMAKVVFLPAYFRCRRWGNRTGVLLAVLWVFLWTWLGHSWQAFWLLGDFPLRMNDMLLWLGVGSLVAINGVLDFQRAQRPTPTGFSFARAIVHSLKVVGVFACVSVFWAQWGNPEVLQLLFYSSAVLSVGIRDALWISGTMLAAVVVGVVYQFASRASQTTPAIRRLPFEQSVACHLVPLVLVLLLAQPPVYQQFGRRAAEMIAGLQLDRLSRGESLAQIAGYYEELNDGTVQAGPFLGDPKPRRVVAAVDFSDMIQYRDDLLEHELIPNWKGEWSGAKLSINRWGMRDRDRSLVKPPGTVRIAMVGSSLVMGFGVEDGETFSRLLEDRLNAEAGPAGRRYEVLNFGVGRYSPLHRRLQIEHKVLPFEPDLIVYFAHQDEVYSSTRRLATAIFRRLDLEDPCLDELSRSARLDGLFSEAMVQAATEQHHAAILRCSYLRIAERCRMAQCKLLYIYLPIPGEHDLPFDPRICISMASDSGIDTADFQNWPQGRTPKDVLLGGGDHHPNPLGHQLLADRLAALFRERPALLEARAAP